MINVLHKIKSRKFQVWVLATIAFFMGMLPPDAWMVISMLYMGIQGAIDWAQKSKTHESPVAPV